MTKPNPPKRILIYIFLVPTVFVVATVLLKHYALDSPLVRSFDEAAQEAQRAADKSEQAFDEEQRRKLLAQPSPISSPTEIVSLPSPTPVTINTEEQLEARNKAAKSLTEWNVLFAQTIQTKEKMDVLGTKIKTCESSHLAQTSECQLAKNNFLGASSELTRLFERQTEIRKEIEADFCIVDPSRKGC